MNDIFDLKLFGKLYLFADDMSLILSAKTYQELNIKLNSDLKMIESWLKTNRLVLNLQKTNYNLMGRPREESTQDFKPKIGGFEIKRVFISKVLGLCIDSEMKFDEHIIRMSKDLNKLYSLFTRLKKFIPEYTLNSLYKSLVKPKLEFGCVLWGFTYDIHINKIAKIQKRFARLITGAESRAHSTELFESLKWFPILKAVKYHTFVCIFKALNGLSSENLLTLFEVNSNRSSARLGRHSLYINAPNAKKNMLRNTIFCKGVDEWNSIPPDIRVEANLNNFKTKITSFLNEN